ncbi:MAG: hypothetical protein ACLUDF_08845, partial [Butyricicoccus sp.]
PFQSRPKVPIQKLSPSRSQKSVIHAPAFLAFAMQMLFDTRYRANWLKSQNYKFIVEKHRRAKLCGVFFFRESG